MSANLTVVPTTCSDLHFMLKDDVVWLGVKFGSQAEARAFLEKMLSDTEPGKVLVLAFNVTGAPVIDGLPQ